jgi:hypothetical protein
MAKRRKEIGSFVAIDSAGRQYTVCISVEIIVSGGFEGGSETEGMRRLSIGSINGERINRISKGHYATLAGVQLRSTDPNAE